VAGVNKVIWWALGLGPGDPDYAERAAGGQLSRMATSRGWTAKRQPRRRPSGTRSSLGKLADICERYLNKGKTGLRGGRLETAPGRTRKDRRVQDGVICESMQMLGRAGADRNGDPAADSPSRGRAARRVDGAGQRRLRRRFAVLATSPPVGRGMPDLRGITECSRVSGALAQLLVDGGAERLFACPLRARGLVRCEPLLVPHALSALASAASSMGRPSMSRAVGNP